MKQRQGLTVLVAGVNGALGSKVATALSKKANVQLRGLVRNLDSSKHHERLVQLVQDHKIDLVQGDFNNQSSLEKAVKGVNVVVSVVQGDRSVIVEGQSKLLEAAKGAGVIKFIPSDYSFNYFPLQEGENINSDWRREFAKILAKSGIKGVHVFNGGFHELLASPFLGALDLKEAKFNYWGTGEFPFQSTCTDDVALFTAEAATDPDAPRLFEVAGDSMSPKQFVELWNKSGRKPLLKPHCLGSIEDGKNERIRRQKAEPKNIFAWLPLMYYVPTCAGITRLTNIVNSRYPHIKPVTLADWLKRDKITDAKW